MIARKPKIVLVGAGNVASHLAAALARRGFLSAIAGRTQANVDSLAAKVGVPALHGYEDIASVAPDIVLISVADSAIVPVAEAIGSLPGTPLVLHTSGTVAKEALLPVSPRTGVLYPLQTFSKGTPVDISKVPFFTEAGDDDDLDIVDAIAMSMSAHVYHADAARRRTLHIAGVFTSNFTNVLLESVQRILAVDGYGLDTVRPLLEATVAKAFAIGPHAAQTGPARRGDTAVTQSQQNALPDELKEVYAALTELIVSYHKDDK